MTVVGTHRDGNTAAFHRQYDFFHNGIHVYIPIEVIGFEPGKTKEIKAGERGFTAAVTVMMRGVVKARVNGQERPMRVRSIVKIGERWKIAEL